MRLFILTAVTLLTCSASAAPSMRHLDPVVITGAELPSLLGCEECVHRLVAFAWIDGAWKQAPIQVDERHIQDFYVIKNGQCNLHDRNMKFLVYADPETYSGADEDPALDMDDEIVFMARDLGEPNNRMAPPAGVVEGIIEELEVTDQVSEAVLGYIYLFLSDGSLDQAAGTSRIQYSFNLTETDDSHDYFDVYNFNGTHVDWTENVVVNPEDSYFQSEYYRRHFSTNWNSDNVNIYAGDSTGEDLMAHQDFQFKLGRCDRCVYSFQLGHTGLIANTVGPIRAVRSWVGANSGSITQRETIMYEQKEDVRTFLRVHPIPGIMDYVTYKESLPMTFYNCRNEEGILIDGINEGDNFNNHFCPWEFVTGRAGSLLRTYILDTDIGDAFGVPNEDLPELVLESWFYDNEVPEKIINEVAIHPNGFHQCSTKWTSQKSAWGTHGVKTKDALPGLPNTDPNRTPHTVGPNTEDKCDVGMKETLNQLDITNSYYYLPPGLELQTAKQIYQESTTPLAVKNTKAK